MGKSALHGLSLSSATLTLLSDIATHHTRSIPSGHSVVVAKRPKPMPSPPSSPIGMVSTDLPIGELSLGSWMPRFVTTLQPFSIPQVPDEQNMVTFHPEFLSEHLGGADWNSGFLYITGTTTCILKNRSYYLLDSELEPYLPAKPCDHGAKLAAFFNKSPEEVFGELPGDATSYEDVPLFILRQGRYKYFGNYSQTRWSDRLDYDTMKTRVPQSVKNFWAKELASPVRQTWVTEELKKHFFGKPEYEGSLYSALANNTALKPEEEAKIQTQMAKDVKRYIEQLRESDREAAMKAAMIKPQFILDAFEAVSF